MIDPAIFEDEDFGKLSAKGKILFICCIVSADDEGKLHGSYANIRALCFRFERISLKKISNLLEEVASTIKNFKVYNINNSQYIQLLKWTDYQVIREDRLKPSKLPSCPSNVRNSATKCPPNVNVNENVNEKDNTYSEWEHSLLTHWNSFCNKFPTLSKVISISDKRRSHLKRRFESKHYKDNIYSSIDKVSESKFLCGQNERGWKVTFDWLISNDNNYLKILEERYKDKPKTLLEKYGVK